MTALRLLAALVLAAVAVVLVPASASACSCKSASTEEYVARADVVVRGTVTAITPPPVRKVMSSTDPVTYTVSVTGTSKGPGRATLEVQSPVLGASCGLEGIEEGRDYVVFAERTRSHAGRTVLTASLCGGTAAARPALVAEVEAVAPGVEAPEDRAVVPTEVVAGQTDAGAMAAQEDEPSPWILAGAAVLALATGTAVAVARARRRRGA